MTCPAGITRPMSPARTVTFGAACAGCPLREPVHHRQGWPLHDASTRTRACCAPPAPSPGRQEFRQAYPTRSMIERVIAWTATQNGRRVKLRYIGTAKNDAWLHNRCAALNLRTLLRHGLTRSGGAWVLT